MNNTNNTETRFTLYGYVSAAYWARASMPVGFGTIADACAAAKALRTSVEVRNDAGQVVGWARARGEWNPA